MSAYDTCIKVFGVLLTEEHVTDGSIYLLDTIDSNVPDELFNKIKIKCMEHVDSGRKLNALYTSRYVKEVIENNKYL